MTKVFVPPTAPTLPAFLPETKGAQFGLAKYRNVLNQGVVVYKLSDGTYVQDVPTKENSNTNIPPYPLMPDQELPNLIGRTYAVVPISQLGTSGNTTTVEIPGNRANGLCTARIDTVVNPYVVTVYEGGHSITVSNTEATALSNFTAHGIGYAGNLT